MYIYIKKYIFRYFQQSGSLIYTSEYFLVFTDMYKTELMWRNCLASIDERNIQLHNFRY